MKMTKTSNWILLREFKRQKRARESPQKCAECHEPIHEGETYTGEVWRHRKKLVTFRRHLSCDHRLQNGEVWCAVTALSLL